MGWIIHSDIETLVKILFLGNFLFSVVIGMYAISVKVTGERRRTYVLVAAKFFQSLGWMGLAFILYLPLFVSVDLGQNFLYTGLYLESLVMLGLTKWRVRTLRLVQTVIYVCIIVSFNAFKVFVFDNHFQAAFGAYSIFLIMVIPGISFFMGKGKSPLKRLTGFLFVLIFLVSLARTGEVLSLFSQGGKSFSSLLNDFTLVLFVLHMHIGGVSFLLILREEADLQLAELAFRDPLTGLYNRRHFLEHAKGAISYAARTREEVAMLFFDLDFFKRVNDQYGHNFGDEVLRDFSAVLKIHVRGCDIACRYGGEEFVVFLANTGRDGAVAVAGRIRDYLRSSKFPNKPDFTYTVSVGIACRIPPLGAQAIDSLGALVNDSDSAVYRAKDNGRDRIEVFGE